MFLSLNSQAFEYKQMHLMQMAYDCVMLQEKWMEVASMAVPRAGVTVAAVNGLLYAVGGRTSSRDFSAPVTVDSVEIYDPHLDTWTEIGNMITSRCDGGVAVL